MSTLPAGEYPFAGAAKVDVTPGYPVRLGGFSSRREESSGVTQRIWAKALVIGRSGTPPCVLLAIDNLGVRLEMVEEVARRLKARFDIPRENVALTFSHSHTTPLVSGAIANLFGSPIPPEHLERIDRYTRELTDSLEQVAALAIDSTVPARVKRGQGQVTFSSNRRTPGGPVDHDLPVLVVESLDGRRLAVYTSYACHCVTLSDNKVSGDWGGYAQAGIERDSPGCVAMISIGCAADLNPDSGVTGDRVDVAKRQGDRIASEVERVLQGPLIEVNEMPSATLTHLHLQLEAAPGRVELEQQAEGTDVAAYNAAVQLKKLRRGEKLLDAIRYPVQTWSFGTDLAIVFLASEVCVDYSLRLKHELDPDRLWINAYANDFSGYIPSERLLKEGGYGAGAEIVYFGWPARIAGGLEEQIIDAVRQQLPAWAVKDRSVRRTHS